MDPGNRVVLVGGASGIGAATASMLAGMGVECLVGDRSREQGEQLSRKNERIGFFPLDVRSRESLDRFFEWLGTHPAIHGLVYCAADLHSGMYQPFEAVDEDRWEASQEVNFLGAARVCRRVLPLMKDQGGSIVHITSVGATRVFSQATGYGPAKAALEHFTRGLALEWSRFGVRVNAVAPGYIDTPGVAFATRDREKTEAVISAKIPLRRLGKPEEVAECICFLLGHRSSYVTGSIFSVDGGWALT